MLASRSAMLLRQRPRQSLATTVSTAPRLFEWNGRRNIAATAGTSADSNDGPSLRYYANAVGAATLMIAAAVLSRGKEQQDDTHCEAIGSVTPFSVTSPSPTTSWPTTSSSRLASVERIRNQSKENERPRSAPIHHMHSARTRNMREKYNIDWKTVLGEGAYGSVHPARLAGTSEKVRPV